MNDYWNDPPEKDDLPECCGDAMDCDANTGVCHCPLCGKTIDPMPDVEPVDFL